MEQILLCREEDKCYPAILRGITGMPSFLYYRGDIEILNQNKNIAIVGSRHSSDMGLRLAYETGRLAAEKGFNVVNGLALGCDAEAIKGAISVGGKCAVVLPCGLENVQPKSNRYLAEQILENGGCLLSEYPEGTVLRKYNYVARDRIQSGISHGVVIVEAEVDSGTMHTADFARRQYKRLACYASKILQYSSGNKELENKKNAKVLNDLHEAENFFDLIKEEPTCEQLCLKF